jgi:hypothetical protein
LRAATKLAERNGLATSPYSYSAWSPLYDALQNGELVAIADLKDRSGAELTDCAGQTIGQRKEILKQEWQLVSEADFAALIFGGIQRVLLRPGSPPDLQVFAENFRLVAADFDDWLRKGFPKPPPEPSTKESSRESSTIGPVPNSLEASLTVGERKRGRPKGKRERIKNQIIELLRTKRLSVAALAHMRDDELVQRWGQPDDAGRTTCREARDEALKEFDGNAGNINDGN